MVFIAPKHEGASPSVVVNKCHASRQEYIRRGKESVVLCVAVCKRTLHSTKVKLRNITQNVPQTSGVVTASMHVATIIFFCKLRV